jgi:hypothetical protein
VSSHHSQGCEPSGCAGHSAHRRARAILSPDREPPCIDLTTAVMPEQSSLISTALRHPHPAFGNVISLRALAHPPRVPSGVPSPPTPAITCVGASAMPAGISLALSRVMTRRQRATCMRQTMVIVCITRDAPREGRCMLRNRFVGLFHKRCPRCKQEVYEQGDQVV